MLTLKCSSFFWVLFISLASILLVEGAVIQDGPGYKQTNLEEELFGEELEEELWDFEMSDYIKANFDLSKSPKASAVCATCVAGMNHILEAEDGAEVLNRTVELCIDLGVGNDIFCEAIVDQNKAEVVYIIGNSPNTTGKDICGVMFGGLGCETDNPDRVWVVTLPDVPKPQVDEPPLAQPGMPTLKVLHLADTHYDPDYFVGADTTNCAEIYLCCREANGIAVNASDGAGFWGDYRNCDLPKWTLAALYENIAITHPDIDFIIWTGDLVPHDVWDTSRESNLAVIHEMADLISQSFPDTPVFPAVGNHEASPVNLFPQPYITDPEFDISWLYDELVSVWSRWLPQEVATSLAYGGYYNVQIRPGLRVLSLNTNYCYSLNYWQVLDSNDIASELERVAQELQDAEDNGDSVYIIGHHPSGGWDCALTWSHEFNKIVSRYENTVTGIFYGHTHKDHFQLFFDPNDPARVYEIGYIAQSQTTYSNLNPGYKIYTIEGDYDNSKFRVLDHENWIMELEPTNAQNQTKFSLLYTAKDAYNLTDLSPQSLLTFVYQMNEPNSTLFEDFFRNYVKAGTTSLNNGCNDNCKYDILCRILIADTSDESHCADLLRINYA